MKNVRTLKKSVCNFVFKHLLNYIQFVPNGVYNKQMCVIYTMIWKHGKISHPVVTLRIYNIVI